MRSNIPVLAGLAVLIAGFTWGAFHYGPPGVNAGSRPAPPRPVALASPFVNGFGPVPGCTDKKALVAVIGLLRDRIVAPQTGVVNAQETSRIDSGRSTRRICSADVVTSRGQTAIVYDILTLPEDTWRISTTIQGDIRQPWSRL